MKEVIFNLFIYSTNNFIIKLGATVHTKDGTDEEKIIFLRNQVAADFTNVINYDLPENFKVLGSKGLINGLSGEKYAELHAQGTSGVLFEHIFQHHNAPKFPLMVITSVIDGKIVIHGEESLKKKTTDFPTSIFEERRVEWTEYIDDEGFHLDKLINDDFFKAIRLLFQNKLYISSCKLLMICIDTIAYIEYDDTSGNFKKWIDAYTGLKTMDIKSEELWEHRNSILHMTNYESRKVRDKKVRRLILYSAQERIEHLESNPEYKYFNYKELIHVIAKGIEVWALSYNNDSERREQFIKRYDTIISDTRVGRIKIE